jgi:microcystin degradation protein MlrC
MSEIRTVVGQLFLEANSFNPRLTRASDFVVLRGPDMLAVEGSSKGGSMLTGILLGLGAIADVGVVPSVAAMAPPGGPLEHEDYLAFSGEMVQACALARPRCVLLDLHGACTTTAISDMEGDLLRSVRSVVGPGAVIGAGLDLHAHITDEMLTFADFVICCKENPHRDFVATGRKLAQLCVDAVRTGRRPVTWVGRVPMVLVGNIETDAGPLRDAHALASDLAERPGVLDVSIANCFPLADVRGAAQAVSVICDGTQCDVGEEIARIADLLWHRRTEFVHDFPDGETVLAEIERDPTGRPYVVADYGDRVLSGAPGDRVELLRLLVEHHSTLRAAVSVTDPDAVEAAYAAGAGGRLRVELGGHFSGGRRIRLDAEVVGLSDGEFRMAGPLLEGSLCAMGPSAVLRHENVTVLATTKPAMSQDRAMYISQGVDLQALDVIVVKSGNHFQMSYEGMATPRKASTAGVGAYAPGQFNFTRREPIYPEAEAVPYRLTLRCFG